MNIDTPDLAPFQTISGEPLMEQLHNNHDAQEFTSDYTSAAASLTDLEDAHPAAPRSPSSLMELAGAHPLTLSFQNKALESLYHQVGVC